ncbi:MAG: thiamine pyrophosphate-binding protein, partial [Pseudolabrys sp.]
MNNAKTKFRGADAVAAALERIDAGTLFVMSGNQLMPVFDACLDHDFRLIHVRHEASAVHMADAWGRMTGTPGIALLPAGPGFLNGLTALYSARMSESPVVLLSGHAPTAGIGKGAFQEMQQAEIAAPLCKASWTIEKARDLGAAVQQAAAIALSGRPGPVHVALPFDLLNENVHADFGMPDDSVPSAAGETDFAPVLGAIAAAERPLILAGPLLLQPHLKQLHQSLRECGLAPVVAMESPRGINDPALGALAEVLGAADLVVLLGKRADYTLRFGDALAKDVRVICIDPEEGELARAKKNLGDRLILSIKADLRTAIAR